MVVMEQTTMLAIFAIALALGLTAGMLVIPTLPQVFAQGSDNKFKACEKKHKGNAPPFCIV
jgi:hypothetical protein